MFFPEKIHIKENDFVLEIWPWGSPHYRSDVLFDRFYQSDDANAQSWWTWVVRNNKTLIISKYPILPFKDKSFDYVICSHVLEHIPINEVDIFMTELLRVSKRWYVEFPSIYYEWIFNFNVHTNIIFASEEFSTLYFTSKWSLFHINMNLFYNGMQLFLNKILFSLLILFYKEFFFTWFEFNSKQLTHIKCSLAEVHSSLYPSVSNAIFTKLWLIIWQKLWRKKYNQRFSFKKIEESLQCPNCCNFQLEIMNNIVHCVKCEHQFSLLQ